MQLPVPFANFNSFLFLFPLPPHLHTSVGATLERLSCHLNQIRSFLQTAGCLRLPVYLLPSPARVGISNRQHQRVAVILVKSCRPAVSPVRRPAYPAVHFSMGCPGFAASPQNSSMPCLCLCLPASCSWQRVIAWQRRTRS